MFYGYKSKAYFNEVVGHAIFTKRFLSKLPKQIGQFCPIFFEVCPNLPHSTPLKLLALTQKLSQNTSYLPLGRMSNWFTRSWRFLLNSSIFAIQNLGNDGAFHPTWLHAWQQWLMAMWVWSFCGNCKPVDNSRWLRKDKFGMVSEIGNTQKNA